MPAKKRPNLLFLLPDQLRHDFLGCYGASFLKTPNMDALASRSTLFETAISPSPICLPARASMLTGMGTIAHGVIDNIRWLRPDRAAMGMKTWPEHLSDAGYHTAAIGKMHFFPWDAAEGFETRVISEDKRHFAIEDDYFDFLAANGAKKIHANEQRNYQESQGASFNDLPEEWHVDRWVADRAVDFIEGYGEDRPFAVMVGFPGPHCPYDPPESALAAIDPAKLPEPIPGTADTARLRDKMVASFKRAWADLDLSDLNAGNVRQMRHHYAALVERLDADVGRILAALASSGHASETVVVFASDHGDYIGDFDLMGKAFFHEPSIRVPLMISDPRRPGAVRKRGSVSIVDLYPTFLDIASVAVEPALLQRSLLREATTPATIFGVTVDGMMVRSDRFKLVRYPGGITSFYDLEADPHEQHDLWNDPRYLPERDRLDHVMTDRIIADLHLAHLDKFVPSSRAETSHPFYKRGWKRPYPGPG